MSFQHQQAQDFINQQWDEQIVPQLTQYIRIPNKSPLFDPQWQEHGYMEQVVQQFEAWCLAQNIPGAKIEVVRLPGRTPLLFLEIPGQSDDTVLLYGHLDKQPEMEGWDEEFGPWDPVIRDDKLYGRGGADDGYACFASLTAIMALQRQNRSHARCVVIIEACEESGSIDLPYYVDALAARIGAPSLVVCLDSGAGNYEQMWLTTSLRGNLVGVLRVDVLTEGVHSGAASGAVPSSFRIAQQLLARVEDRDSGQLIPEWLNAPIPQQRLEQAQQAADILGDDVFTSFPLVAGAQLTSRDAVKVLLAKTWQPTLSYTGVGGMPALADAGNVLRPYTALTLSFRFPPTLDGDEAAQRIKQTFEADPPYGAKVSFVADKAASGWHAPPLAAWLEDAVEQASMKAFGKPAAMMGEGGSIPFMGMLGEKFPAAQFVITGVLGPGSNAHGPNEFLHIPFGKRLTLAVADILDRHFTASQQGLTAGGEAVAGHRHFNEECC
ncbi:MAG: M20 family metallopeptidase [Oceanococcus sp.]